MAFIGARAIVTAAMLGARRRRTSPNSPPQRRFAGFAFARELGSLLAGGPASRRRWPLVAGRLYAALLAALTVIAIWFGPETYEDVTVDNTSDGRMNLAAVVPRHAT